MVEKTTWRRPGQSGPPTGLHQLGQVLAIWVRYIANCLVISQVMVSAKFRSTNVKKTIISPHRSANIPPCQMGLVQSIKSILMIHRQLMSVDINYLCTAKLNQDCLEVSDHGDQVLMINENVTLSTFYSAERKL